MTLFWVKNNNVKIDAPQQMSIVPSRPRVSPYFVDGRQTRLISADTDVWAINP